MRSVTLAVALCLGAAACSSPFAPQEGRLLAASRAKWEQRTFADYTFEARRDCFCPPEEVGPVRMTVRQGTIVELTLLETGEAVDPLLWLTIEQLYDQIPRWGKYDGVDDVTVDYDPSLGFPSRIEVRYEEGILDAGLTYTVSNVGPA